MVKQRVKRFFFVDNEEVKERINLRIRFALSCRLQCQTMALHATKISFFLIVF